MKNKLFTIATAIMLASCGGNTTTTPEPSTTNHEQPSQTQTTTPQKAEAYFMGSGDGVTVSMEAAPDGTFPIKVTESNVIYEGKLSKEGLASNSGPNVKSGEAKFSGVLESAGSGVSATVSIVAGDCTASGSSVKSHSFVITIGEKSLKGCGQYSE